MVQEDVTESAHLLLRAVNATKGKFGLTVPIEVLLGRKNARIKQHGFENVELHGSGAHFSEERWKAVGRALISECLLEARSGGKGFGKKGGQMQTYSVSTLGNKMLSGDYICPILVDLAAHAEEIEAERATRAAKRARKNGAAASKPAVALKPPRPSAKSKETTAAPSPAREELSMECGPAAPTATVPGDPAELPCKRKLPTSFRQGTGSPQRPNVDADAAKRASDDHSESAQLKDAHARGCENGLMPPSQPGPITSPATSPLPKKLDAALLPFQRAGVAFALRREGRVLIGDDMGLGKTIQGIAVCAIFRQDWPALIVVPNSVRLVWADELERWIPDMGPEGVNIIKSGQDLFGLQKGVARFHIVTYGILTRASAVRDYLRERRFKIIVVDECHMIKNKTAKRTQEILCAARQASRVILLSGTPALARPIELYTQIECIEPGVLGSYSNFTKRFCDPKWTPFGMDVTGASNLEELHALLRPIMVRRLKRDVLTELPSKRRQRVQIEVSAEHLAACAGIREQSEQLDREQDGRARKQLLMELYRATSAAKIEPACEYLEDLIAGGCKLLIFGHHLAMLDGLEAAAVRSKVRYIRIDGSVNSAERIRRVTEFQSDDGVQVAILGILAAGVGLTLTAASTVVFAELHWTPGVLVQAEDRAHRIGQKSSVNVHYLVASGTIDDIIWPCVVNKVEVVSAMCDGQRDRLVANLTSADSAAGGPQRIIADDDEGDGLLDAATAAKPSPSVAVSASVAESSFSVLSMLQGRGPMARGDQWICGACSLRNDAGARLCSVCGTLRKLAAHEDALPRRFPPQVGRQAAVLDVEELLDPPGSSHGFVVSPATGRVHVMDSDDRAIGFNFKPLDWTVAKEEKDLPQQALGATDAFLHEWAALKLTEQRLLVDQVLRPPLRGALQAHKASTSRVRKRAAVAEETGEEPAPRRCAWCSELMAGTEECCSAACFEKHSVRKSHAAIRWQLFAVERGVCQLCRLDAHGLYERVRQMAPEERHQEYLRAGVKATELMLQNPHEGLFWQGDHILPVSEGGGECDLSNLRTLCTTCHAKQTRMLNSRLKCARWGKDSLDVRRCFEASSAQPEVVEILD